MALVYLFLIICKNSYSWARYFNTFVSSQEDSHDLIILQSPSLKYFGSLRIARESDSHFLRASYIPSHIFLTDHLSLLSCTISTASTIATHHSIRYASSLNKNTFSLIEKKAVSLWYSTRSISWSNIDLLPLIKVCIHGNIYLLSRTVVYNIIVHGLDCVVNRRC